MKTNKRIIATLLLLLIIGTALTVTAEKYYMLEREECFKRLTEYTEQMIQQIKRTTANDQAYLVRIADNFTTHLPNDRGAIAAELNAFAGFGLISRLELILPDGQVITADGKMEPLSQTPTFEQMAQYPAIWPRTVDPQDPSKHIIRYTTPVTYQGQTTAVLSGIVDLTTFSEQFPIDGHWENMNLYISERNSGAFLLDNWHGELGNGKFLGDRQTKYGYSWEQFEADLQAGKASTIVLRSETSGQYFFVYTIPMGISDWRITVNVLESDVFAQANNLFRYYLLVAILLLVAFCAYFGWILWEVRQERQAYQEQLDNIRYILNLEKELFDAHLRPEHFITAMQKACSYLTAEVAFIWLADGFPDIKRRLWSNSDNRSIEEDPEFLALFPEFFPKLQESGAIVSYDPAASEIQRISQIKKLSDFNFRSLMLVPVEGLDGQLALVLGACNMTRRWPDAQALEQVSVSVSMAVNHYEAHLSLARMGQRDALTGLFNRNSYNKALEALAIDEPGSIACIYIDANGLHEINNHLGHQAGDEMLITIANLLADSFGGDNIYRIGGDEFVVLMLGESHEAFHRQIQEMRQALSQTDYTLSIGAIWQETADDIGMLIAEAESAMQQDKRRYYQENGRDRRMRTLDNQLEQMLKEKQDAEMFLSVLASEYRGVYFVDLIKDTIRHLYIPTYFKQCLQDANQRFSQAIQLYAQKEVKPAYRPMFEQYSNYAELQRQLDSDDQLEFIYQKSDGQWLKVRILKFKTNDDNRHETLWIFAVIDPPEA